MTTRSPRLQSGCTRPNAPNESPFQNGPIRTLADLEEITGAWVHWDSTSRLEHRQQQPHGAATHTNPLCAKPGILNPKRGRCHETFSALYPAPQPATIPVRGR